MRLQRWIAVAMCLMLCGCAQPYEGERILISHSTDSAEVSESTTIESAEIESVERESTADETQETQPPETETAESLAPESVADTESATFVLNTNTKKFHKPDCSSAKDIKEKNRAEFSGDRAELINRGYEPCKRCNP